MAALGIDFGTSNTAAAVWRDGAVQRIELEPGNDTLPTAVFLDYAEQRTLYGTPAARAMIAGHEGRFMRALKSILGTSLAHERRQFMSERLTLIEIIARFLEEIRRRAQTATGTACKQVVSGRPVRFHSKYPERNAQALKDLHSAYELAGFEEISFLPEPEAAARACNARPGEIGLIVDIGGGTSDFTLFEGQGGPIRVIANHGVRVGGTDFDKTLSLAHVMPCLGLQSALRKEMGAGTHPAPRGLFVDLASWEKIAFVYGAATSRDVARMARLACEPVLFERLQSVVDMHLGHDVAYAVEAGKIAANGADAAQIKLDVVEKGLHAPLTPQDLVADLAPYAQAIRTCAQETLERAELTAERIDRVFFVGGSSLARVVRDTMKAEFPNAAFETTEVFTAVVDGLAQAAGAKELAERAPTP